MPFNVIYIDDEPDLLEMFSDAHASEHVAVLTFSDPLVGLKAILERRPDLVILDYRLPHMSGDEIASKIDSTIPKILITGDLLISTKNTFDHVFGKPYDADEMQKFIDKLRERKNRN